MNLRTGDIVKLSGVKISVYHKINFFCEKSNQYTKTTGFSISGLIGEFPFANGLVKKRFVTVVSPQGSYPPSRCIVSLYMLDNYKPLTLGRGFKIDTSTTRHLKKVGRILNIKDLPYNVRSIFYKQDVLVKPEKGLLNKSSRSATESIKFIRKNKCMLIGLPKHIEWALYLVEDKVCQHCGENLMSLGVSLYDLDSVMYKEGMAKHIAEVILQTVPRATSKVINTLPIAYVCKYCRASNIVVEIINKKADDVFEAHRKMAVLSISKKYNTEARLIYGF